MKIGIKSVRSVASRWFLLGWVLIAFGRSAFCADPPAPYPFTRSNDTTDTVFGAEAPDPYRWLESSSTEVESWTRAQNELAKKYLASLPGSQLLGDRFAQLFT